ncbi:MAG TPA: VWA domain-containing protein [Thermoanaerobaculia bacterium]|nr:VWA domain-containing protein [Thermoanaerobaculia bacterium]
MRWPLAVAALPLISTLAFAQVRETVDVTITNLDLVVTDSRGKAVRGLAKGEFDLLEGGKAREITNFSEVSAAMPATGSVVAAPSRSVLIVFDNTTLTMPNRRKAADAVKGWMAGQLRPADRIAVLTVMPGLQMKQPWTFDSRAAAAAVDVVAGEGTTMIEQERREAESRIDEVVRRAGSLSQNERPPDFDEMTQAVRAYSAALMRDCASALYSIKASIAYFPPNAQKKVIILVGEGMPTNPGSDLFHYLNNVKMNIEAGAGPQVLRKGASTASPLTEASEFDLGPVLRDVTSTATRRGVMLYAINPGQNEKSGGTVADTQPGDIRVQFATSAGNRAGYEALVRGTGGTAFYGTPPEGALAQISNDLDAYYSLGYRAVPGTDPNAPMVVKSKSGYKVRVNRAAAPQSADDRMRETVLANHITAPASNDLRIALAADPPVADGDRRKVHLKVLIPIDSLQIDRDGEEVAGGFTVYVSSGDNRGAATTVNRQEHQFRWPATAVPSLKGKTITFAVDVLVPAGLNQISVGVIDQHSQQTGFDRLALGV